MRKASVQVPLPPGVVSAGLAATAVLRLVKRRRRRRQIGHCRVGRRLPVRTGAAARAETALRLGTDPWPWTLSDRREAPTRVLGYDVLEDKR